MEEYFLKRLPNHLYFIETDLPCALKPDGDWTRGKIIRFDEDMIYVKLVDEGRVLPAKWGELYEIPDEFLKLKELAIECSLIHVDPLDGFASEWHKPAIDEFKKMTMGGKFRVTIVEKSRNAYKVILYLVEKKLNINSFFCASGFANSSGLHSAVNLLPEQLKSTAGDMVEARMEVVPKRTKIVISHFVDPGEFYIQCEGHLAKIAKFQKVICGEMKFLTDSKQINRIKNPEVGVMCLVNTSIQDKPRQWYRAKYKTTVETKHCVLLIDYGKVAWVSKLYEIPSIFEKTTTGAVKCHLACIKPTGKSTSHLFLVFCVLHLQTMIITKKSKL